MLCVFSGSVYAAPSERSVYHGGSRLQFPVRHGWHGLRTSRSDQQTNDAQTQSHSPAQRRIRLHLRLFPHVPRLYAHETAVRIPTLFSAIPCQFLPYISLNQSYVCPFVF